jgi:Flp pilus assembly protein TadG
MRPSRKEKSSSSTRGPRQRGTAMVEMALTMAVFLTLFIGILDVAQLLFIHETLSDRVRAATRAGAVYGYNDATLQNIIIYGKTTTGRHSFYGVTASNIEIVRPAAGVDNPALSIRVTGVRYKMMTPLFSKTLRQMPIRSTRPLETVP